MKNEPTDRPASPFAPTRWTLVLRAQGDSEGSRQALGELCEAYWNPVFRFLRSQGRNEDMARELTQAFFANLLGKQSLQGADPNRGRFRTYLLGALKHFLADHRDREMRQKRGGNREVESLEALAADSVDTPARLQVPDPKADVPDHLFDRQWALTVMEHALQSLEKEFADSGKQSQFATLKPWLVGKTDSLSQAEAATHLQATEGAVKVMIHRLRKRFREQVRAELAHTVNQPHEVDAELRYLVEVLARG